MTQLHSLLLIMEFAIVDIETTGGNVKVGGITEIAVVIHDGHQIVHEFQTLINPEQGIPTYIIGLTGIDNQMVRYSPRFEDIADELWDLLENRVFVAHQVNFDFGFIAEAYSRIGRKLASPKLCTVRLARKVFPGMRSYSLGRVCESRGIPILARHRAMGDAKATAILFDQMLHENAELVYTALKKNTGESFLPPNFPIKRFRELPQETGIYYMLDQRGKVIYVGKANNIKERFKGHFTGQGLPHLKSQLKSEVHDLQWELSGTEMMALLMEAVEIKRLWPKYNAALKLPRTLWGIFGYRDGLGYQRFQIAKVTPAIQPLETFFSREEAQVFLKEGLEQYQLCAKLSGLRKVNCQVVKDETCLGACEQNETIESYNQRALTFIQKVKERKGLIQIDLQGRTAEEKAICIFERGMLVKYGFLAQGQEDISSLKSVKAFAESSSIFKQFFHKIGSDQVRVLDDSEVSFGEQGLFSSLKF
ncbi:exonuclease domain-containing protein [Algoriphagus hitonicola]|uniref:DNA polymerase-3 subunit epsilon n=1 Tax=Algoriphagus hitonicola TaxID=435880 RepID=A0A1I2THK3_9BACT|nr:exonuclease domain-containing protein [Algoriphagus hitonicola]SFG64368.1 DNA polymerase-3 subunit epsilon [Algoriphagus hitonicola]